MLMSVYLEEGNYARAEALLEETFQARTQKDELLGTYFALAGQAVNGARMHLTRYRSFGVSTNDTTLPTEVTTDLSRLRSLLERMIAQAKEISSTRKAYDSLSLLEDVVGIRLSLAVDSEDQSKWEVEYLTAREALASSQTQIASLGGIPPLPRRRPPRTFPRRHHIQPRRPPRVRSISKLQTKLVLPMQLRNPQRTRALASSTITQIGSLNSLATKRVLPQYPTIAKQSGAAGLVRVHVILDESGNVASVSRSEGHMLLRQAAENAARQWSFQIVPTAIRPARVSGYIDFNFTL